MNHAITNILLGYESFSELRLGIFSELDNHGDFLLKVSHFTAKRFMFPLKKKKKRKKPWSNNAAQMAFLCDYLFCSLFVFFPNRLLNQLQIISIVLFYCLMI